VLGSPLRYVNVDVAQWRAWALRQGADPHAVEHLSRLWPVIANAGQCHG
jgi:hypothetical protein